MGNGSGWARAGMSGLPTLAVYYVADRRDRRPQLDPRQHRTTTDMRDSPAHQSLITDVFGPRLRHGAIHLNATPASIEGRRRQRVSGFLDLGHQSVLIAKFGAVCGLLGTIFRITLVGFVLPPPRGAKNSIFSWNGFSFRGCFSLSQVGTNLLVDILVGHTVGWPNFHGNQPERARTGAAASRASGERWPRTLTIK